MQVREFAERCAVFVAGLFTMALGIALTLHADLGITPISCPPYVLSLGLRPTVGQFTIAMHVIFVLLQVAILRRDFPKVQFLQIGVGFLFGFFIDLAVWLTAWCRPEAYAARLGFVVLGSAVVAAGIVLQVLPRLIFCAGEGLMLVISKRLNRPFGKVKVVFDCTLLSISLVFSLLLFGGIRGVREGTVVSALLVGFFVGKLQPLAGGLGRWLDRRRRPASEVAPCTVVTIAREFGSGGREVGEKLARRLGWKFYDRQLINLTVEQSGLSTRYVERHDQRMTASRRVWKYIAMDSVVPLDESLSPDDRLFVAQSRIVRRAADEGRCVIVGRCADAVLRDRPGCLRIFVRADRDFACRRVARYLRLSPEEASREVDRVNALRANHYNYYTGGRWDDPSHYDLVLNTSAVGIDGAVDAIASALSESVRKEK